MKKHIGIILVLALLLAVLSGCEIGAAANLNNPNGQTITLTKDQALEIALTDAQLTKGDIRDLDIELDRDNRVTHYDVGFEAGGYEYDYEIHPETGEILNSKKQRD